MPYGWFFGPPTWTPEVPRQPGVNQGRHRGVTKTAKPKARRGR